MKRTFLFKPLGVIAGIVLAATSAHADLTMDMRVVTNGVGISNTTAAETLLAQASSPGGGWEFTDFSDVRNDVNVSGGNFGGDTNMPNGSGSGDRFALRATANLLIPAGTWTIGFGSDDGGSLKIGGITFDSRVNNSGTFAANEVRWETGRGHAWTFGTFTVASDTTTTLDAMAYENTGGESWEVAFAPGTETSFSTGSWDLLADTVNGWTVQVAPINDVDPPVIAELSPADDSSGAYPGDSLVATFDEDLALTGAGTITVAEVGGDGSSDFTIDLTTPVGGGSGDVTVSGTALTIDPAANLEQGQEYEVTISAGALQDTWTTPNGYGGTISGEWTFTPAAFDASAPTISGMSPADDDINITPVASIVATFSVPVLPDSGNISIVDVTGGGTDTRTFPATDAQVSFSGSVMTIVPDTILLPNQTYAIQIDATAVKNYSEVNFAGIVSPDVTTWNFETIGPRTLTWDPAGGGTSDGGGTWLNAGTWWDGSANVDWISGSPDSAVIGNGGAGGTITLGAVNAGTVLLDNFTGTYTFNGGSLDQSGGITIGTTAGAVNLNSPVGGTGGVTVNGPSRVNFRSGAKTFTGDLVITGGGEVLEFNMDMGTGNLTINDGVLVDYWSGNMNRTLGSGPGQVQILGGTSGFCGQGSNGLTVRLNNGDNVVQWGDPLFNPSTLVLQTPWANTNGKVVFRNRLDLNGAPRTIAVNKDHADRTDGYAQILNPIENTDAGNPSGLTKTGPGRLILSATNTYDGGTNVNEGIMYYQRADAMPPTGNVAFATGTELEIEVGGGGNFTDATSGAGSLGGLLDGTAGGGGGTVSYAGDIAMKWYVSGTLNYGGPITAAGGNISNLWIRGGSTLTLSGTGSSFTGPIRIGAPGSATTVILGSSTALPSGNPLTVDSSGVSILDLNGNDATIGLLSLGSNNGGSRGQVTDTAGGGTLTLTNGVFCDDHNNGNGGIFADTVDLNGGSQTFSVRDGSQAADLLVSSAIQNGALVFDAVESGAGLELSGASTYTGGTDVSGGTLTISGSLADASMDISGGTVNGTGTLTFNVAGAAVDQIFMSGGTVDLSGFTANISGTLTEAEYVLVTAPVAGTITGTFAGLTGAPAGYALDYSVVATEFKVKLVGTPGGGPPYTTWTDGFAGLTDTDSALDFDKGGLDTGIEWVVGGDPTNGSDDAGLAPSIDTTTTPGSALFVFRQTDAAGADDNTTITVEYGSDGENWTTAEDGINGVGIALVENGFATGVDKVTVTLPDTLAVDGLLLARLKVVVVAP